MKISKYLIIVFIFTLISCSSQKILLKNPLPNNPTSYIFKTKLNEVTKLLQGGYIDSYYSGHKLKIIEMYHNDYDKFKKIWPNRVKTILSTEENKYDIWMKIGIDSSEIYINKDKPLEYLMECLAHLSIIDSNTIKVEIIVLNAKVHLRDELLPRPPHFINNPIYKNVAPTTIEEYKILQCIGKGLGILNQMPPLKI